MCRRMCVVAEEDFNIVICLCLTVRNYIVYCLHLDLLWGNNVIDFAVVGVVGIYISIHVWCGAVSFYIYTQN